jgi:molybdate transport system substrate-binding protein
MTKIRKGFGRNLNFLYLTGLIALSFMIIVATGYGGGIGGGGGGGTSGISYSGLKTQAIIDEDNAEDLSAGMAAKEKMIIVGVDNLDLRPVLDPVSKVFTKKTGIKANYSYDIGLMELSYMQLSRTGDVLILALQYFNTKYDYMDVAIEKGIIDLDTVAEAGYMIPVICVQKGNPKNIISLEDLTRPGIKIGVGEPDALAVGRLTEKMLKKQGLYDAIMKNVELTARSTTKLIVQLAMKNLDVVINWLAVAKAWKAKVDYIKIPPEKLAYSVARIGMTTFSKKKEWARKYLDFVSSKEGRAIFEKYGFGAYFDPKKIEKVR